MVAMGYVLVVVGCASVDVLSGSVVYQRGVCPDGYLDWHFLQVGVWIKVQSRSMESMISTMLEMVC